MPTRRLFPFHDEDTASLSFFVRSRTLYSPSDLPHHKQPSICTCISKTLGSCTDPPNELSYAVIFPSGIQSRLPPFSPALPLRARLSRPRQTPSPELIPPISIHALEVRLLTTQCALAAKCTTALAPSGPGLVAAVLQRELVHVVA